MSNPDCCKCGDTQSFINGHDGAIACRNKLCIEVRALKAQLAKSESLTAEAVAAEAARWREAVRQLRAVCPSVSPEQKRAIETADALLTPPANL